MVPRLPFIDEHVRAVPAPAEVVWAALVGTVDRAFPRLPGPIVSAWGLDPGARSRRPGTDLAVGDSVPGFVVAERDRPRTLVLRGQHRFSQYELRFDLDEPEPGRTLLRARTSARFPGVLGAVYQTLVITSRGHRFAVRRLLKAIASRA